jgi:hypothetical protein
MVKAFRDAMAKLAVLGQDTSNMVDCSEVIPEPKPLPVANCRSVFPPGFTNADVDEAVLFPLVCLTLLLITVSDSVTAHPSRTFQQTLVQPLPSLLREHRPSTCNEFRLRNKLLSDQ